MSSDGPPETKMRFMFESLTINQEYSQSITRNIKVDKTYLNLQPITKDLPLSNRFAGL